MVRKEKGMNNILVSSVCGIGLYALLSLNAYADSLAVEIKENVKDNWEEVSEWCGEVVNLEKGMALLPENSWIPWKRDRSKQREDINELRQQIKEMLLSVDSHKLLKKIAKLDAKIADVKKKIENIREEMAFRPDTKEKNAKKIAKLVGKCRDLESARKKEVDGVRAELESIGIKSKDGAIDGFIMLVNQKDFTDVVILSRGVYEIVECLKNAVSEGNVVSSTRYYGIYVVLMDLQMIAYEEYLLKSKNVWRARLDTYSTEVEATITRCKDNIRRGEHEKRDVEAFEKLIASNNKLLYAIDLYRKLLKGYESSVEERLKKTKLRRERAQCTFETSSNILTLASMLQDVQSEFSSLMELELPEIKDFSDSALNEQIRSITLRLDR
jgi:predicted  nucleic acid-binding Zn-ribbon protein